MLLTKRYTSGQKIHLIYVFLFGFFLGVFLMNIWKSSLLAETGFLDEEMLYQLKYMQIDGHVFFFYVLKKRLALFFMLLVFATTYLGVAVTYGALVWFGFSSGMLMAAVLIRYGLKGILLICASVLPQYIVYVPVFWLLLNWCYEICRLLYFPAKMYEENRYRSRRTLLMAKGMQALILLAVVIIGVLLESYVNPIILISLLKIF